MILTIINKTNSDIIKLLYYRAETQLHIIDQYIVRFFSIFERTKRTFFFFLIINDVNKQLFVRNLHLDSEEKKITMMSLILSAANRLLFSLDSLAVRLYDNWCIFHLTLFDQIKHNFAFSPMVKIKPAFSYFLIIPILPTAPSPSNEQNNE